MTAPAHYAMTHVDIKAIAAALGVDERAVQGRAKRGEWPYSEQPGRGGKKRIYPLTGLPTSVREAILRHQIKTLSSPHPNPAPHPNPLPASGARRNVSSAGVVSTISTPALSAAAGSSLPAAAPFYSSPSPQPSDETTSHSTKPASGQVAGYPGGRGSVAALKDWQRDVAAARSAILHEVKRLSGAAGVEKAIQAVIALAMNNELSEQLQRLVPVANAKAGKDGKRSLSRTSIYRWMKEAEHGFAALAPKAAPELKVPAWAPALLALYQQPQKPTLKECLYKLQLPEGMNTPSYWAVQRFLDKMSRLDLVRGRMLPRELKNVRAFVRRDTSQMWPGDAYTADGHTFDAEIAHPRHGKPFRPEITSVLDIATRKCVGWSVGLAESTWAVLDAVRFAVETCGICSIFYVDNGSGYKNELMADEATGFMARLGISMTHSLPYNSQARGIIERSHQTLWVNGAKELPTYMGATMDREAKQSAFKITRKDIKAVGTSRMLMKMGDFVKWCEARVAAYNNKPHHSLPKIADPITGKMRHQSPNEAWAAALADGWEPVTLGKDEAADLFRPYRIGKTTRAEVRLFGNTYFHKSLEDHHGERVRIGYDIHDPQHVWVRDLEGRLICIAEFEANKRDYFPKSMQQTADEKRAAGRIKRAQVKIDEAEEELNPPLVIEQQTDTAPMFEFRGVPAPAEGYTFAGYPPIEALPLPENAAYLPLPRPIFNSDSQKFKWLRANPSQKVEADDRWLDWYCDTSEWEDLFGDNNLGEEAAR